jgi:uncharacterized protein YegL
MINSSLKISGKLVKVFVVLLLAIASISASLLNGNTTQAITSTVSGSMSVSPDSLVCGNPTTVTMNLTGVAGITQNPVDVMLVLDDSGSMSHTDIINLKAAARAFTNIIDKESDGERDGVIGNGSRVGIVRFSSGAQLLLDLSNNANSVINVLNNTPQVGGSTNHTAAFSTAQTALSTSLPDNKKIIIMFTDGQWNLGGDPITVVNNAKTAGTEIYTIGLGAVNMNHLNNWATDPDEDHSFLAPNASELESIFEGIGASIVTPAATNISIVDKVNSGFTVSNVSSNLGTATLSGNDLNWTIPKLLSETATLTYTITHNGGTGGSIQTSDTISYTDDAGQNVVLQSPIVNVTGCDTQPPVTDALLSSEDGYQSNGWYNKDVLLTFNATDDQSGVVKTEYKDSDNVWKVYNGSPLHFSDEGTSTISYRSVDNAGNVEVEKTILFNIDKSAPVVTLTLDKTIIGPPNHKLVPINVAIAANDPNSGSGIRSIKLISITSNEPDSGAGDIQDAEYGTDDRTFTLRAERLGNGTGRVYTISYLVEDEAGNETTVTATVTVAHDQSKKK